MTYLHFNNNSQGGHTIISTTAVIDDIPYNGNLEWWYTSTSTSEVNDDILVLQRQTSVGTKLYFNYKTHWERTRIYALTATVSENVLVP